MKSAPSPTPRFAFPDGSSDKPTVDKPTAATDRPAKPAAECDDDFCPYCQQPLPGSGTNVLGLLRLGVKQLIGAVRMIFAGVVRCLRFAVAGVLCLVGLVGSCCYGLASRIAHRDDRKFLFRR